MQEILHGKWLHVSDGRIYGYPDLIEFNNKNLIRSLLKGKSTNREIPLSREDKLNETVSSLEKIETLNENRVRLFRKGLRHSIIDDTDSKTEEVSFENDYVRLLSTITSVS